MLSRNFHRYPKKKPKKKADDGYGQGKNVEIQDSDYFDLELESEVYSDDFSYFPED